MKIIEVDSTYINMNINIYTDTHDSVVYDDGDGVEIEQVGHQRREHRKSNKE